MAIDLRSLKSTKRNTPPVIVIYGVDGVGKTQLASEFPDPIYLPTSGERAPSEVDIPSFGTVTSYDELLDAIGQLLTDEHEFKTLIVDSLDGIEPLIWKAAADRLGAASIEAPGYGRGYVEADAEWSEYLAGISELASRGMCVVQIAHPAVVRFDSPTSDPYDRYNIKLHKRAAALVRERADIVGFIDYRTVLKEKEVGPKRTHVHGEGVGERRIYLEERPGFVAKNRYSMPPHIVYRKGHGWDDISKHFPAPAGIAA